MKKLILFTLLITGISAQAQTDPDIWKLDLENRGYTVEETLRESLTLIVIKDSLDVEVGRIELAGREGIYILRERLEGGRNLLPCLTTAQRDTLTFKLGQQILNTTNDSVVEYWINNVWRRFSHTTVASLEEGGVVISESSNGSALITDSANFYWDNAAKRLGIGTSSPAHNLHLVGNFALGDTTTGDVDAIIYFGDDGDVTAESFMWNDGDSKFELTDDIKIDGDVYTTSWTTYGGTSTIVGWTSNTSTLINYKKVGNLVFIQFYIDGVSDATNVTFTLPFTQINTNGIELKVAIQVGDNSTQSTTSGLLSLSPNSAMASCFLDMAGASWTASNNKRVQGQFWYESQ